MDSLGCLDEIETGEGCGERRFPPLPFRSRVGVKVKEAFCAAIYPSGCLVGKPISDPIGLQQAVGICYLQQGQLLRGSMTVEGDIGCSTLCQKPDFA